MAASGKLNSRKVETAKPGAHGDGGGLWLHVSKSGNRTWSYRYMRAGRAREMGLGSFPEIGLADARDAAAEARKQLASQIDPIDFKKRTKLLTFGSVADHVLAKKEAALRNAESKRQWKVTLTIECAPLRLKPVAEITTEDVLQILTPRWTKTPITANNIRSRIETVIDAGRALGQADATRPNPARWRGHLDHLLPKIERGKAHYAALPYRDLPTFMAKLRAKETVSRLALEFLVLTCVRAGECLGARWSEIDVDQKIWRIPAERMKAHRSHDVPLSDRALQVLAIVKPLGEGSDLVFPGRGRRRAKSLSFPSLRDAFLAVDTTSTLHGLRSTFRDWAGDETGFPSEVAELALAHAVGNRTERAYRRSDAIEKRRILMQAWADYLSSNRKSKVVPLRAKPVL